MTESNNKTTELKQVLLSLVGNAPFGIIAIDFKGKITLINHKATTVLDLEGSVDRYLDVDIRSLFNEATVFKENIEKCVTEGRFQFDLPQLVYEEKILSAKARLLLTGMLITFEEITERVNAQKQLKERTLQLEVNNKELAQFAYISSHDLQEPLFTILSFTKLIFEDEDGAVSPEIQQYLEIINAAAQRMSSQIRGLLEYSRIGKNKEKTLVNTQQLADEIQVLLLNQIKESQAQIETIELPEIYVFKEEFESLLQNIISNALKYHKSGLPPEITICAKELDDFWQFSITDNGIGIAEEHKERVFIIFQRLHNRDEYSGSGIGLAHCKKITQLHGGEIWFESTPGLGTTFHFTIKK